MYFLPVLDYKNNIWKERVDVSKLPSPKVIDLDTGNKSQRLVGGYGEDISVLEK